MVAYSQGGIWDDIKRYRISIEGDEGVLRIGQDDGCIYLWIFKNHWLVYFKWVTSMECSYMSIQLLKTTLWAFLCIRFKLIPLYKIHTNKSLSNNSSSGILWENTLDFETVFLKKKSMKHAIKILRITFAQLKESMRP